jgi:hypothetical protein
LFTKLTSPSYESSENYPLLATSKHPPRLGSHEVGAKGEATVFGRTDHCSAVDTAGTISVCGEFAVLGSLFRLSASQDVGDEV